MGYQAALIVLSTIATTLLVPPLVWHIKTLNVPAITLIVWLLLMDLKIFIDAIIWGSDDFSTKFDGRGYCDLMIKLQVGANVGISSSVAGVMFNLYRILRADSVIPEPKSFKKIGGDLGISLGTPVVVMGLNYLVQSRRYYIMQYSGCQNVTALSWVTIIVYTIWMVIWSFIGVIFAGLIIWTFLRKRKDVKDILRCTNSGLTLVRFAKLLIFCMIVILVMFPLSLYTFSDGINRVEKSYNFQLIHSKVVWFTVSFIHMDKPYYLTWIYLAISYVVFIFFGLGSDAIEMYVSFMCKIGLKPIVDYIKQKRQHKKMIKADNLVSGVLKSIGINNYNITTSPSSNAVQTTQFDIEMQQILKDDNKSPTSTVISNIFGDKHQIPKGQDHYRYFNNINSSKTTPITGNNYNMDDLDLDEDDIEYLNMLYEDDLLEEERRRIAKEKRAAAAANRTNIDQNADDLSPVQSASDIDYVYTLQQKF